MNVKKTIMAAMPWSRAAMAAAEAEADQGGSPVALITADPSGPPGEPGQSGLMAVLAAKVYAGQERLAMKLAASGKGRAEIFEALYDDLKARKAEAAAQPPPTAQEVAAEVLKELRAGAPPAPATVEGKEYNAYEEYKAIEDPAKRQAFYDAHREDILKHSPKQQEGK